MWKFDSEIANVFSDHAKKHIPNYDLVIDKSVEICKTKSKSSHIIDVGCATGETLRRLNYSGFTNLYGVDNSKDMLEKCPISVATYYCENQLPPNDYDVVIMNWTLHFIRDKESYLESIIENLSDTGIFILSEKTSTDDFAKKFYYDYKRRHGVSDQEILDKEQSLKNVMHVNDIEWYLSTLKKVGFKNTHIFDAHWCFTSFVCFR